MTIEGEDVDRQRVDFSDTGSGQPPAPVHPGEVLRDEFLTPMALGVYRFAGLGLLDPQGHRASTS